MAHVSPEEWISAEDAAIMLAGTFDDLRRLIRMRRIQHREIDDSVLREDVITAIELREFDAVMDEGGSEKEARRRAEAVRARLEAGKPSTEPAQNVPFVPSVPLVPSHRPGLSTFNSQLSTSITIDGHKTVSVKQAADHLQITADQVCELIQSGRLSWCEKVGRTRYVLLSEVEDYKRLQETWASKAGTWTPYGKQERKRGGATHVGTPLAASLAARPIRPIRPTPTPRVLGRATGPSGGDTQNPTTKTDDRWITAIEVAPMLGVRKHRVYSMVKEGKLTPRSERRWIRTPWGTQIERSIYVFSLRQVVDLAAANESKRPTISPAHWNKDLRHPIIRTEIVPPPGDRLISRAEAAEILGVAKSKIGNLVTQGKLFGWQKDPGKKGVRLWLSERQVLRYRDDPIRLKRREARLRAMPQLSTLNSQLSTANNPDTEWPPFYPANQYEAFMLAYNLEPKHWRSPSKHLDKDRGEFFTTRQAALTLGVTPKAVASLRIRGRLPAFQRPCSKRTGNGNQWWFYRKDDVYNLLADGEYLRNRDRGKRWWRQAAEEFAHL